MRLWRQFKPFVYLNRLTHAVIPRRLAEPNYGAQLRT
ncbi:hypothetical protein ACVMBY_007024 [Bradyrhizobium huanghuaihaiense]